MGPSWSGHFQRRPFSCFLIPLISPPSMSASSVTTGRPSPALTASPLNKRGQLSYLPPHFSGFLWWCGVQWLGGAQAKPQRGGTWAGSLSLSFLSLTINPHTAFVLRHLLVLRWLYRMPVLCSPPFPAQMAPASVILGLACYPYLLSWNWPQGPSMCL